MKKIKYSAFLILIILMACSSKKSNIKETNTEIKAVPKSAQTQIKDRIAVLDFKTVNVSTDKSK